MQPDTSCSRSHAALVHHEDGRLFIIDLQSVRGLLQPCTPPCPHESATADRGLCSLQAQGTFLDGKRLLAHKPTHVTSGSSLSFGALDLKYVIECEKTGSVPAGTSTTLPLCGQAFVLERPEVHDMRAPGTKRAREDDMSSNKGTVRASHLLVKHRCAPPSKFRQPNACKCPGNAGRH